LAIGNRRLATPAIAGISPALTATAVDVALRVRLSIRSVPPALVPNSSGPPVSLSLREWTLEPRAVERIIPIKRRNGVTGQD
jgi:hypothetical protein